MVEKPIITSQTGGKFSSCTQPCHTASSAHLEPCRPPRPLHLAKTSQSLLFTLPQCQPYHHLQDKLVSISQTFPSNPVSPDAPLPGGAQDFLMLPSSAQIMCKFTANPVPPCSMSCFIHENIISLIREIKPCHISISFPSFSSLFYY